MKGGRRQLHQTYRGEQKININFCTGTGSFGGNMQWHRMSGIPDGRNDLILIFTDQDGRGLGVVRSDIAMG